jgi:hypothetical protein
MTSKEATTGLLIPKNTPPGAYHVCAMADSTDKVIEIEKTNNSSCSSGTITVN